MSANNYMLIHKVGDRYYAWDNLMAEEAMDDRPLSIECADMSFNTLEEAVEWANANDTTEYGYQINNLHRPKDGYPERIKELPVKESK